MKKNMRRVSLRVTAQTLYNLERLRQMGELKSLGRVVDKLVREKMISLHKDHVNAVKPGAPPGKYQVFRRLLDYEGEDHVRESAKMMKQHKKGAQKWIMKRFCEQR